MLKRLYANKSSFREIRFRENSLNIILATKHKDAAATASRNGLGKSTFVNIISFCLGLSIDTKNELPLSELSGWAWTLELEINRRLLSVTRSADAPDHIIVLGNLEGCPVTGTHETLFDSAGSGVVFSEKEWRQNLCWLFFGLSPNDFLGADDNPQPPDYPSLASHFVRRYFDDPVRVNWADSWVKSELAITYLLGLDWTYLARAKKLRQQDDKADSIVKGAKVRMEGWKKQTATLEAECAILKRKIDEAEAELARYNTIPHAQLVEGSIEDISHQMLRLEKELIRKKRILESARRSRHVRYVSIDPVEKFYRELNTVFTDGARKTYEDVRRFHDSLTVNRTALVDGQIRKLEAEILNLERRHRNLGQEKERLMAAINANNAYEEFTQRSISLDKYKQDYAVKMDCLEQLRRGEEEKRKTEEDRAELVRQAQEVHEQLRPKRESEERLFASIINNLYSEAIPKRNLKDTSLGIEIRNDGRDCGISYSPHFWGDRSLGKKKLKAFAFDLTIIAQQKEIGTAVDFMVHDSVLYESSDSRQYAKALSIVAEMCAKEGLQYIGVMNSDDVSTDDFKAIMAEEKLKTFVIHELTDAPSGKETLLGEFFPKDS